MKTETEIIAKIKEMIGSYPSIGQGNAHYGRGYQRACRDLLAFISGDLNSMIVVGLGPMPFKNE